jgi:hypothetical protein
MSLAELLGGKEVPRLKIDDSEVKKPSINPFDFVTAIQQTGEMLIVDEWSEKQYNPYIINRANSMGADTAIAANEMNCRPHIPKAAQFRFLVEFVRKRKRYNKWMKSEPVDTDVKLIADYYGFNLKRARGALPLHTPEQLQQMRQSMRKGGKSND